MPITGQVQDMIEERKKQKQVVLDKLNELLKSKIGLQSPDSEV